MQGQGPLTIPNHLPRFLPFLPRDSTTPSPVSSRTSKFLSPTSKYLVTRTAGQIQGTASSGSRECEGPSEEMGGPAQPAEDRVRAEEPDSGEHCSPEDDWKLRRKAARYAPASQRSEYADQREDGEEAQQAGSVVVGRRCVWPWWCSLFPCSIAVQMYSPFLALCYSCMYSPIIIELPAF